jgi:hypothetical protein
MASDDDFQLSDLLESYLSTFNPKFLELLSSKYQYLELTSSGDERIERGEKGEFKPQKHQEFLHRFLRDYDDLLDFSATGTGKTGSIAGFMEKALREHEKAQIDPSSADPKLSNFKRCLILFKGKTLADSFRNQLVSKISDGRYLEKAIELAPDETNEKARKSAIKRVLAKAGYVVDHYEKFAKKYDKLYQIGPQYSEAENNSSKLRLAEHFADTIFWIDEAHNLNIEPDKTKSYKVKLLVYEILWRIFHYSPRCKRIISTATPALNNVEEQVFLLNLILPLDGILPASYDYQNSTDNDLLTFFPGLSPNEARAMPPEKIGHFFRGQICVAVPKIKSAPDDENVKIYQEQYGSITGTKFDGNGNPRIPVDFRTITEEELEPYLRGRIFYIKNRESRAVAVEQGIIHEVRSDLRTSYITTWNTQMSDFQEDSYAALIDTKDATNASFYDKERQGANLIYPNGAAGKAGFDKYINLNKENFSATDEFKNKLTKGIKPNSEENINKIIQRINKYSCKDGNILKLLIDYPGIHQVYSNYVRGSGGISLGVCLEMIGYERFNESSSVFALNKDGTRRIKISKGKRYALLNGDKTSAKDLHSMMELLNSDENMFGEYLQCIITSSTGRDGINIYNMIVSHLQNPEWNPAANYQALSRGIRVDSQDKLLEQIQNIIDDLHNLLSSNFVDNNSELYSEAKILIIALSGGIKLQDNFKSFNDIIDIVESAIKNYKGNDKNLINKANKTIVLLRDNEILTDKQKIMRLNINAIKDIFGERLGLYYSLLQDLDGENIDDDLAMSINILLENIQYLLGELSIRTININIVNYYKVIKSKIQTMINQKIIYQDNMEIDEYTPQAYLEIKVFKHAAIPLNLINENDKIEAIDLKIYKIGEAKHHNIERILTIMRKNSVGSIIYANINKDLEESEIPKITEIDYGNYNILYSEELVSNIQKQITEICRNNNIFTLLELSDLLLIYQINYVLNAFDRLLSYNIPFTNKNGKFISDVILKIIKELFPTNENKLLITIINRFIKNKIVISRSLITEKTIIPLIEKYQQKFIIIALENLINNKIQLTDKFGYTVYMRENNGYFYLDKSYPSINSSDFRSSYYTDNLIIIKQNNLEHISDVNEKISSLNILDKIKIIDNNFTLINEYLDLLSIKFQALILEKIIIEALRSDENYFFLEHNNDNYINIIINKYKYYIIWMNEPYSQIKNLEISLLHQGPRPGRPLISNTKKSLPNFKSINKKNEGKELIINDTDTELVYIHTLYSQDTNRVKYGQVARVLKGDGRKRIIKITELDRGWRDIMGDESVIYNEYTQPILIERNNEIINRSEEIIQGKALYGIVMEGVFRLIDKQRQNDKANNDDRHTVKGRICKDFKRPYLIEILWRLGDETPDSDIKGIFNIEITEDNKEEFISGLLGEIPIYYHGHPGKSKKKILGDNKILKRLYQREDLVPYTYEELIEWELNKLNFYYRWNIGKFDVAYICETIQHRMSKLDIIEYR